MRWVKCTDLDGAVTYVNIGIAASLIRHKIVHNGKEREVTTIFFPQMQTVEVLVKNKDGEIALDAKGEPLIETRVEHGHVRVRQTPEELLADVVS